MSTLQMAFALCAIFCNVYYIVHWSSTVTVMVKSHGAFGASLSVISEHGRQHRGERAQHRGKSTAEQQSTAQSSRAQRGGHWSTEDSSSKLSFKAPTLQAS